MSSVLVTPRRQPEHPCGCPGPCSEPSGPGARTRCSPLHFPAHPKAEWRGLPGGRFDPDRHRLRPWRDAMRIWSGSGAQNSPGTVDKVTASTHSIQIGIPSPNQTQKRGGPEGPPR